MGKSKKKRYNESLLPRNLLQWKKAGIIYLMMAPALILMIIYKYVPMAGGLMIMFKDYRITRGIFASDWCGLKNVIDLFTHPFFPFVMGNTVIISLLKLIFGFPGPILLAMMLNEVRHSTVKRIYQTTYYLPHFISWIVIANLLFAFFAPSSGALSPIFQRLGIHYDPLMTASQYRSFLVITDIWKEIGWSSIIYLAAISSIDPTLYEAAIVDGANKYHLLRHVTFAGLIPTIMTMLLLRVGHILNAGFDQIFVLQNSMVYMVSEILDTFTYKVGFQQGNYAMGTVAGLFKSIIGLVMILAVNKIAEKLDTRVI